MKLLDCKASITLNHENIKILNENHKSNWNHLISFEINENYENLRISCETHENHENIGIPCENNKNQTNHEIQLKN